MEGAAAGLGALLGGLAGLGISRRHIPKYEEHIKGGRYLLVAHGAGATEVETHTGAEA